MRNAAALVIAVIAAGCASPLPDFIAKQVSPKGASFTDVRKWLGISMLRTGGYVPGTIAFDARGMLTVSCGKQREHAIALRYRELHDGKVGAICRTALKTIEYVDGAIALPRRLRYEIMLVPAGFEFSGQKTSISLFSGLTAFHVLPLLDDDRRTQANIADTLAHESLHVRTGLSGNPGVDDERQAYLFGICAQLRVLGRVSADDLPGAPIASKALFVSRSSEQAYSIRREIWPLLNNGAISLDSSEGRTLIRKCEGALSGLISLPPP